MNTKLYLPVLALALTTVACGGGKKDVAGIDPANLDTTVMPGTDFYQYACGGWMKAHPLTAEYARFGSFDLLAENNREQLKSLIGELAAKPEAPGSVAQKIGDLYNVAMDSVKLNADGVEPIRGELEKIAAITDVKEMSEIVAEMRRKGFDAYFVLGVGADEKNSAMNIVYAYQSGMSLGEREYYLDNDDHTREIREKYREHVANMFRLAGFTDEEARKDADAVLKVETMLAEAAYDNVKLRDPQANYHKMKVTDLKREVPGIDWDVYLAAAGLGGIEELNVGQPEVLKAVADIWNKLPLNEQKAYLQWKVLDEAGSYLSDAFAAESFDFYGKTLSGQQQIKPRWKRAVGTVNGVLGEAVGQMYVEKYFPAAAKERMTALVANLQSALGERIKNLTWMSEETKAKALEKLSTIYVKVGYPNKWRDYSGLEIKDDSYWGNIMRSNEFDYNYMIADAGKPVDRDRWFMTPQTVNAYYNPTTNEICFPAGILQYPFFDMNADDAFNYGAIGVVIGHEMTHGFDDQGRQYDKEGNLADWWTETDAVNFGAGTQKLVNHFDSIEVLPGLFANGKLTLGENIADHGGLQVAYTAFKEATAGKELPVIDGFTPEQRFFLAYANVWAGNIRDEQIRVQTKSDPHSLGRWRVNGALPHINAWYEAFGIQEGDPLYLAPEKRAVIW
ncbi:M13 family metallopeptidase [Culturomica massiliensis]|jgi:putative endopeptidase|uniref:M13 family metallopeptidase n=1 Tax=Culturomica massiliensis TaxID=1841857 RepID=UPI000838E3B1|nr:MULTISPECIES: M13 family metallopeptidase [Odoribacteraceae]RHV94059.1 M13 family peptidase [Odoribacter sp. OF09-27XD]